MVGAAVVGAAVVGAVVGAAVVGEVVGAGVGQVLHPLTLDTVLAPAA